MLLYKDPNVKGYTSMAEFKISHDGGLEVHIKTR